MRTSPSFRPVYQTLQVSQQGQEELRLQLRLSCSQLEEGLSGRAECDGQRVEAMVALLGREQDLAGLQQERDLLRAEVDTQGQELAASAEQVRAWVWEESPQICLNLSLL